MITFIPLETTNKVLKIINNCIKEMIENELFYYNLNKDDKEGQIDYLTSFFPAHLCREETQKCENTLKDLLEWTQDNYLHDLTCIHEYALFKIFGSFFDEKEDYEKLRKKGEKNVFKFHIKGIENYEPDEIDILKRINDRIFYEEDLFWDWDFLYIDDIVYLYQTDRKKFNSLGVNLRYYLDIMPKDMKREIELALDNEKTKDETEEFIIKQISNVINQMEMDPVRLEKCKENEISDDIKNRLQFALEMKNIIIEREARGGFAEKEIGEIDFFLYKNDNHRYIQLALGENKMWGKFENQVKQLLGYANKNIEFGFTIVINKNNTYQEIKDSQKEILEKFNVNGKFKVIDIEEENGVLISTHTIPEENRHFKIYHFILNTNGQARKEIAHEARGKFINKNLESEVEKGEKKEKNTEEIIKYISNKIEKQLTFEEMVDILDNMKEVIFEEKTKEVIKQFKKIGTNKRRKATLKIDNKKYSNIQIFDDRDTPIMGFIEKIRNQRDMSLMYMIINATIRQYKNLDCNNKYIIKKKYIKEALEIAQNKYKILDLLADKKINIYISNKGSGELKSDLYKDEPNNAFEIFIYSAEDAIYTILFQLGSILNLILCNKDEVIPKSFIKVNKNRNIKVDLLKATKEERVIIFSDIFAVTALKNTQFEDFAPFILEDGANRILDEYFMQEIGKKLEK